MIPVGKNGDCYDRYLRDAGNARKPENHSPRRSKSCRAPEGQGDVLCRARSRAQARRDDLDGALIHHFKLYTEGFHVPEGEVYCAVEAPKGEFGVYLVADGTNKPYRAKLRAPGFLHLQAMDHVSKGHQLADVSAIIGTMDVVFGEIDR